MATYVDLINQVLRRMREDTVADYNDSDYSTLVGDFVNEAKREVEDSHKWNALRTQLQVTTAAGTQEYVITGAGNRFKLQDPSRSVYDETNLNRLVGQNSAWMKEQLLNDTNQGVPNYFYFEGLHASGDPNVTFYSIPSGIFTINFDLVVPQDDLAASGTILTIPEWPVILGAYVKALDERGEDQGGSFERAQQDYQQSVLDAIQIDGSLQVGEDVWTVQ